MKELRLLVKIKNNRLVERRESLGLTQKTMAEVVGVPHAHYERLENLRRSPVVDGEWTRDALQIAEYYDCDPGELFPEAVVAVREPSAERRLDGAELAPLALSAHSRRLLLPPDESVAEGELRDEVRKVVAVLPPREQEVLTRVYGLDGEEPQGAAELSRNDPTRPSSTRLDQLKVNGLSRVKRILEDIEESPHDPQVVIDRARTRQDMRDARRVRPKFERVVDLLDEVPGMLDTVLSAQAVACRYWETRMVARVNPTARLKLDLHVFLPTRTGVDPADVVEFIVANSTPLAWTPEVPATVRLVVKYRDFPDDPEVPELLADARAGGFEVDGLSGRDVRLALRGRDPRDEVLRMRLWFCDRAVLRTTSREYAVWCPAKARKTRAKTPSSLTKRNDNQETQRKSRGQREGPNIPTER